MIAPAAVCHWNIRGYRGNYHHLRTLLSDSQASVVCLQESRLPNNFPTCPRGFTIYSKSGLDPNGGLLAEVGGTSILIKNTIAHSPLTLRTNLQAIAFRCHINKLYTICSLYLPPNSPVHISDLEELISHSPPLSYCWGTSMQGVPFRETLFKTRKVNLSKASFPAIQSAS